jgi:hypothetical protein
MSFSFGFGSDDIDQEADDVKDAALVEDLSKHSVNEPLDSTGKPGVPPRRHTLEKLVSGQAGSWPTWLVPSMSANSIALGPFLDAPFFPLHTIVTPYSS